MKIPVMIMLVILSVVPCSCRKREEIKEEKITITVERPDKPVDKESELVEDRGPEDLHPEMSKAEGINLKRSREIIHEIIKNDPQVKELVKEKNVAELTRYLLDNHRNKVAKIAEISNIENERLAAFQLSRYLIRREKFASYPPHRRQDY